MTDDVMTQLAAARTNPSIIMVVGVGGAGGNAVNHMWNLGIKGVDFMVCNTDPVSYTHLTLPTNSRV